MQLRGFQVFKYRNIIDSGWIEVDSIAALVGQNECGKSNLLRALYKFSPFDKANYELTEDWPIDEWASRDLDHIVCKVKFLLSPAEIEELFETAPKAQAPEQQGGDVSSVSQDEKDVRLPGSLTVLVTKDYSNQYEVEFASSVVDRLDLDKATQWVTNHLPRCVYMADYATFSGFHPNLPDLAQRREQSAKLTDAERTILVTLDLAALDLQDIIQKTGGGKETQRTYDTNAASRHLSQQFKDDWEQKKVRFDIRVDGPTLNIFVEDEGLGALVPLESRSRGFQWYVSFIWLFTHASDGEFEDCILLLDEPGLHLHHAGHGDLLDFLERLAETNTLIYTTHLATMLDLGYPERLRIMEVHDHHASVRKSLVSTQRHPMMIIEAALGLSGSMSGLLGSRQNLITEGFTDVIVLQKLSGVLQNSGEPGLSDRIYLVPAFGAPKIPMYAGFMVGNEFDAGVLLDSDEAGEHAKKRINDQYLKDLAAEKQSKFRILMLGEIVSTGQNEFAIEDLFPVDFYLKCVNNAYGTNIEETELPNDGSDQISKRVEAALVNRGLTKELDKRRVMRAMQREFDDMTEKKHLPQGTYEKARKLIDKINEVLA
jgi:energy-coupling factor transporter ATP-binding protein EcfA2